MSVWRDVFIVLFTFLVHASAYAAQLSLWAQLNTAGTFMDLLINLMSGVCASMANTAFRLKSQAVDLAKLFKELAYGIGIGFVASIVTFAMTEAAHVHKFMQLALVTLAGWGGAKVIEFYSRKHFGDGGKK